MNFEQGQARYKSSCEDALAAVVKRYFLDNSEVSRAAEYALMNGGKRVRGVLALAVCDMLGGDIAPALMPAAAIEMVHAFSLVHDDLPCMDDDDMRRGKPSTHIAFGEANALLAGDLLLNEAFRVLAGAPLPAAAIVDCVGVLAGATGAAGMIYGQELDLLYETKPAGEEALLAIHTHKTGALIKAACHLGAVSAGAGIQDVPAITTYAENIGRVFQIVDDILDVTSTTDVLGKPVGSDEQQQKSTFVTLYGLDEARRAADTLTRQAVLGLQQQYHEKSAFLCAYAEALAVRIQ